MLNPFPVQFLALFAYFLLRICLGGLLIYFGFVHLKHRAELTRTFSFKLFPFGTFATWVFILSEVVLGLMFIAGFYTQIAALLTMIMSLKLILFKKLSASPYTESRLFYVLLFFASLSLFITGAGVFAFDLPI